MKRKIIHILSVWRAFHEKILLRYIVKELLVYFFVMFLFFFLVFFVNQIMLFMKQLLGQRIPFVDVVRLMIYSLPFVIAQSTPFATLTGFLMCLGRMMSDNEILILRASGQSITKLLLLPILILGFIISLFSFFVNDYLLPLGSIKTKEQLRKSISANPAIEIENNSVKRMNGATIIFGDVQDKTISDIIFFGNDNNGNERVIVSGESIVSSPKIPGVSMSFKMNDAIVGIFNRQDRKKFDVITSSVMSMNLFESSVFNFEGSVSAQEMTSYDLGKKIKKMKSEKDTSSRELNMNVLEYNKKFSLPFASLFFAFLAMQLALLFGKNNGQTIGLIIGIFVSVFYWSLMTIGIQLGYRNGYNGFILMWLPNFVVGVAAFVFFILLRRK